MRVASRSLALSVFAVLIATSVAASSQATDDTANVADGTSDYPAELGSSSSTAIALVASSTPKPVGRKDAPVDGKDGRPHQGPFVETEAQRDRQKAKEGGQEEPLQPGVKPKPKEQPKNSNLAENFDDPLPKSNDGIMDDPNRTGPKEGTRGTEGGISEKSRGKKEGVEGELTEKLPDQPKEVPPLPHSEQERLEAVKESEAKSTDEAEKPKAKVEDLELGGLSVCWPSSWFLI